MAQSARAAGVAVDFDHWPEMIHVWQMYADMLPEARPALDKVGACLRAHIG